MMLYQLFAHHHDVFLVNLDAGSVDQMPVCARFVRRNRAT